MECIIRSRVSTNIVRRFFWFCLILKLWPPDYANLLQKWQKWHIFGQKVTKIKKKHRTTFVEHPKGNVWSEFQIKGSSNFFKFCRYIWKNEIPKNNKTQNIAIFDRKKAYFKIFTPAVVNIVICNSNISIYVWHIRINSNFGSLVPK